TDSNASARCRWLARTVGGPYDAPMTEVARAIERARAYGAESMVAPLRDVRVKPPGPAFGRAFEDPAHGFLHAVDLDLARRQHDALCDILAQLGVTVHELESETDSPDLVYVFDPMLVSNHGAIVL